jgi:hypothetical protein
MIVCLVVTSIYFFSVVDKTVARGNILLFLFRVSLVPTDPYTSSTPITTNKSRYYLPPIIHDPYEGAKETQQTQQQSSTTTIQSHLLRNDLLASGGYLGFI